MSDKHLGAVESARPEKHTRDEKCLYGKAEHLVLPLSCHACVLEVERYLREEKNESVAT